MCSGRVRVLGGGVLNPAVLGFPSAELSALTIVS